MSRWFRFYSEALDDPKVQMLTPELFKFWVNLLCVAAKNDGIICNVSGPLHETAFRLKCNADETQRVISELTSAGLIDKVKNHYEPHNWSKRQYKSDTSSERVKRYRERSRNVSETPPEYRVQIKEEKEKLGSKKKQGATMAFVEAGSPEWHAWQSVKKINQPVWSAEHHANGFWFPSRWPQQQGAA